MAADKSSTNTAMDKADQQKLEQYLKQNYKIFMDTCSILEPSADLFWQHIIPLLHQYQAKIIVPSKCIEELNKHQGNKTDKDLAGRATNAIKVMKQLISAGYVEIRGEKTDNFADNVFNVVFTKFRMNYNLLLITQDNGLADDILHLNESKSVTKAKQIQVKRLNKYGYFSNVGSKVQGYEKNHPKPVKSVAVSSAPPVPDEQIFELKKQVTTIPDDKIPITHMPRVHESVYVNYNQEMKELQLTEELGAGGEATIYKTNTPFVAKIYKQTNNTRRKYEKIKLMVSKNIECEGICYPIAPLYNEKKEFVGYLMPAAKGKELQRGIFLVKQLFQKNFPGWKKRDTVQLCITILEKIKYLHDRNIIMGDINPANILVVSPTEVYFVDTDSYQVEDFPCPVGTIIYTAPEIQKKHFSSFLRTMGNENFAVATLLFMIMLPGKPPYSQQGGESLMDNIIRMDFSYPLGKSSNGKTPEGPWRFIWSHLTYDIKEAFYTTFRKGELHAEENTRLDVDDWLGLFRYYLELLDSGKYGKQDTMSEELYPTRFKKNSQINYVTCKLCKQEFPEEQCISGICKPCLYKKGTSYQCSRCGKELLYTNYQKYIKKIKRFEMCPECFEWGKQVHTKIKCVDCGHIFDITNSEWEFYQSKGFDMPKRCKSCRQNKKNAVRVNIPSSYRSKSPSYSSGSSSYTQKPSASNKTSSSNNSKKQKHGSFCFITTAVCEYLGKPDDCTELKTLRNYRDTWLLNQSDGKELVHEYYRRAPYLVSMMKMSEYYPEYCELLMDRYIQPCLDLIAEERYEECKDLYTKMFYYMVTEFSEQPVAVNANA